MNIGRYEVIQNLGQGGMAMVYLARDPYIKRQVAVKVLPRQFTFDPEFRARFQQEAEVVARLEHSAIVPVYDFGEDADQPFIVMRYMQGGTLADRLVNGPLRLAEIVALFERIGSALDHAHSQGIIHRDIKPGNILFDSQGLSYLSDFGISKIAESTASLTGTGTIGTPAYMSPEQAQGMKNLDGRCDIYSLGVVLFQALTGELPYKADTPMGQAMAHITQPVPSLLERKPDLPPTFERIIRKTLDKSPDNRYQTARQLTEAINAGEQEPVAATGSPAVLIASTLSESPISESASTIGFEPDRASVSLVTNPIDQAGSSVQPALPSKDKIALPRLIGVGSAILLFLCLVVLLIGGLTSGLIPNPFDPARAVTSVPSEAPALLPVSSADPNLTHTVLPADVSTEAPATVAIVPSLTSPVGLIPITANTSTEEVLLPSFTARTDMLCRAGPGTDYEAPWQLTVGEVVPVLAQWYQNSNWLLVDINVPATVTRTDCCWVGGEGTLSVSLDQIKSLNVLPDRTDCSGIQ